MVVGLTVVVVVVGLTVVVVVVVVGCTVVVVVVVTTVVVVVVVGLIVVVVVNGVVVVVVDVGGGGDVTLTPQSLCMASAHTRPLRFVPLPSATSVLGARNVPA